MVNAQERTWLTNNVQQKPIRVHSERTGMHGNEQERTVKTFFPLQRPSQIPDKRTNEQLGQILILKSGIEE